MDDLTLLLILLPFIIWEGVWKGIGLWKSAHNNQLKWFIAIFVINTIGILPIVYIYFFQKNLNEDKKLKKK